MVTAVALWIAALVIPGIDVTGDSPLANGLTLLVVAVVFGVINAVLKPLIKLFGCVFYIVTLGLISFVVNALLFMLTGWLSDQLGLPFHVNGFWPAFWGAILVGVVSWAINLAIPDRPREAQ